MKPKMIFERGVTCRKWVDCPLYNKCMNEAARLKFPKAPLNWTCEECPYLKFASSGQVVVFKAGFPLPFPLKELWEGIWEKKR